MWPYLYTLWIKVNQDNNSVATEPEALEHEKSVIPFDVSSLSALITKYNTLNIFICKFRSHLFHCCSVRRCVTRREFTPKNAASKSFSPTSVSSFAFAISSSTDRSAWYSQWRSWTKPTFTSTATTCKLSGELALFRNFKREREVSLT